jgi:uncharacterized glyoxalase superfamily protein PhnB
VAAAWLCTRFSFTERLRVGNHRVQLSFGRGAVIATQKPAAEASSSQAILVRVPDLTRHHAQALAQGVKIIRPPADYPYGERQYTAEDLGGHRWTFSQTIADVNPAAWGGTIPR